MTCERKDFAGGFAIICSRGSHRARCQVDGCGRPSTKLCDFPLTGRKAGKTCDRRLCDQHARAQGENVDYCPTHAEMSTSPAKVSP